ncbi:hypothetical protein JI667_00310 [Bacillus sp. NTK074B]|uniref:hypothetical protein n=1 Tax=Bacillus sp. NTK074B TaxID=2802174 RepID=UPI001A8EC02F|nr:hypothetical protein [Bacillus sp. NTK074B]
MDRTLLIIGSAFLIVSGTLYTLERMSASIFWAAQRVGGGEWPTVPDMPSLFDNLFVALFLVSGIVFCILSIKVWVQEHFERKI